MKQIAWGREVEQSAAKCNSVQNNDLTLSFRIWKIFSGAFIDILSLSRKVLMMSLGAGRYNLQPRVINSGTAKEIGIWRQQLLLVRYNQGHFARVV